MSSFQQNALDLMKLGRCTRDSDLSDEQKQAVNEHVMHVNQWVSEQQGQVAANPTPEVLKAFAETFSDKISSLKQTLKQELATFGSAVNIDNIGPSQYKNEQIQESYLGVQIEIAQSSLDASEKERLINETKALGPKLGMILAKQNQGLSPDMSDFENAIKAIRAQIPAIH